MAILSVERVSKVYPSLSKGDAPVMALREVTLEVQKNEFCSVLGHSGCGKTTLLNMIAGFESCTEGKIFCADAQVLRPGADRSMVFQDYALFPWLTVRDNISFGPRLRGAVEASDPWVAHLIDLVGLTRFASHFPHQLSGGMRQRVSIARALAVNPTVLLMDEPFAALDAQNRAMMQQEMIRILNEETKTVVLVTHSIEEAINLSDVIIVMTRRPGRVKETIRVPRPRKMSEHSQEYQALKDQIRELISNEQDLSDVI